LILVFIVLMKARFFGKTYQRNEKCELNAKTAKSAKMPTQRVDRIQ
jgi:hypothetical protein